MYFMSKQNWHNNNNIFNFIKRNYTEVLKALYNWETKNIHVKEVIKK